MGHSPLPLVAAHHLHRTSSSSSTHLRMSPADSGDDTEEWKAVVAAFKLYKAAYGDLKVPQRFVVPDMAPWPKKAWGLKLGKIVQGIRSTGKFLDVTDEDSRTERRTLLDQLGFVWNARRGAADDAAAEDKAIRLDQVVTAVEAYRSAMGNADVPENFVVPDTEAWPEIVRGLPLGRQLEAIKGSEDKAVREKFASLGVLPNEGLAGGGLTDAPNAEYRFPLTKEIAEKLQAAAGGPGKKLSANDVRFRNVYMALATYKHLYDDLIVPQPFVVPVGSPDWPEETWGLRLGARVNAIRSQGTFVNNSPARRALLDELGFEWSPPLERRRGRKPKNEPEAMSAPQPRPVQPPATMPQATAAAPDEAVSAASLTGGESLDSLFDGSFDFGRDFDLPSGREKTAPTWNLEGARLPEIAAKAAEQEAAMKEDDYVPPRTLEESLSEATERALECGVIEGLTENRRVIKGKREKNIPWYNDDFGDDFVFEDVVEALTLYKSMYGDFSNLTNSDFVVPAPKERTGFFDDDSLDIYDVDASARAAAAIANYKDRGLRDRSEDFIAAEIKRLQEEVDQSFELESDTQTVTSTDAASDDQWPEHLAGMTLGSIVTRIRDGSLEVKHLRERKEQLDAIDFDWGDPMKFIDVPFEKAMCAMYAYYLVRGDMFVYEDFVMPDEDPWPQVLAGYELGKAVKRIRELQNFFEAYHPDKVSLLRTIDFVWFADTLALPLDPNEKEMTPETLLLSAMGHPDYAKMIDIPMGLPDKIIADGPFVETNDDPKLWWRKWHNWDYVKDYWYQQGRRDNAYVLRQMGYPKMAEEHEAKYGPGLFEQIDAVMKDLENSSLEDKSLDEKRELLEKLNFFRQEMLGCTDIFPEDRDNLISDLDTQMLLIVKDTKLDMAAEDEQEGAEYEYEKANGIEVEATEADIDEIDEEDYEEVDFDIEDELGLDVED